MKAHGITPPVTDTPNHVAAACRLVHASRMLQLCLAGLDVNGDVRTGQLLDQCHLDAVAECVRISDTRRAQRAEAETIAGDRVSMAVRYRYLRRANLPNLDRGQPCGAQ